MAVRLSFLLILTALTGIHSVTTVTKVSVKAGDSVSIPCLYGSIYEQHVKYLCKGFEFLLCSTLVETDISSSSGKFSISEDPLDFVFTVTIKNVTDEDTGYYWCAVRIKRVSDVSEYFHLSVSEGTPSLYVDNQEVTGFTGDDITISCYYSNSGDMKWCMLGGSCVTMSGSLDGIRVTINASVPSVFTVTMSGLSTESSGWYWCAKGNIQLPVHVTVTERSTTSSLTCSSPTSAPVTTVFADTTSVTVQGGQQSVSLGLKLFIIPLSLLIFAVMVTLFIWFMCKRYKRTNADSLATTTVKDEVAYSIVMKTRKNSGHAEEEVTYSNVQHAITTSEKQSDAKSDVEVTYSSVVTVEQQTAQTVEANNEDVTYSRLTQH